MVMKDHALMKHSRCAPISGRTGCVVPQPVLPFLRAGCVAPNPPLSFSSRNPLPPHLFLLLQNTSSSSPATSFIMGFKVNSGLLGFVLLAFFLLQRQRQRKASVQSHGCEQAVMHQPKEPFSGFDFQMNMYMDIPFIYNLHQRYGNTYQVRSWVSLPTICTIAPENLRTINISKDFGVAPMRLPGMEYFCGRGFITTDGETWRHSRKLLKPSFDLSNIRDLNTLKGEVDALLQQLPKDGSTVDLQPLLYVMVSYPERN